MSKLSKKKTPVISIAKFKTRALKKEEAQKIKGGDGDETPTDPEDNNNIITDDVINF